MSKNCGIIGVSDHGGWAVLVTVARDGTLLDRRRVELVGEGLPKLPHHSEGQRLPPDEAVKLVERVRVSAERRAVFACLRRRRATISLGAVIVSGVTHNPVAIMSVTGKPEAMRRRTPDHVDAFRQAVTPREVLFQSITVFRRSCCGTCPRSRVGVNFELADRSESCC